MLTEILEAHFPRHIFLSFKKIKTLIRGELIPLQTLWDLQRQGYCIEIVLMISFQVEILLPESEKPNICQIHSVLTHCSG